MLSLFCRQTLLKTTKIFQSSKHLLSRTTQKMPHESKKMKSAIKIGTHDGVFHCDELLGCYMLKKLPQYKDAQIVRTRKDDILKECDIVIDVGAVFDRSQNRFDHHQATFKETFGSLRPEFKQFNTRLSSAGLVYVYFGEDVIKVILKEKCNLELEDEILKIIYHKVYKNFIEEIDGVDNGVPQWDEQPRYEISSHLSSRVSHFNPSWNKEHEVDVWEQFQKAMAYVGQEFTDKIVNYAESWWPARSIVAESVKDRFDVHKSGEILELKQFCPWKQHLYDLENDNLEIKGVPKFVLYQSKPDDFRLICVPKEPNSFICRKFLHKDWRGKRDSDLGELSGIEGASFCHANGFIGGATTRDASLEMAVKSLEENQD